MNVIETGWMYLFFVLASEYVDATLMYHVENSKWYPRTAGSFPFRRCAVFLVGANETHRRVK